MDTNMIQLNFNQAMAKASELEEIAGGLMRAVNGSYEEALQITFAGWKGENADAYLRKGTQLEEQMMRTANQILQCAQELRRMAERIYRAEVYAASIAGNRIY